MIKDKFGNVWYKGNLHTHTRSSDGRLTPEETLELYKSNGYDFISLTDHWVVRQGKDENGILCLTGCEYNIGDNPAKEGVFHIVGIGMKTVPEISRKPADAPQEVIDKINASGGIAILAHPAWSLETPEQIKELHGFAGTEIYNSVSAYPWNLRPYSGHIIDCLAAGGYYMNCMAADDSHFYNGDACRSYIMVKADELTEDSILAAIKNGDFYATQGPEYSVTVEGDIVTVETTPVNEIVFFTDALYATNRYISGEALTLGAYKFRPNENFVRVELKDADGRMAWSSPIKLR